MNGIKTILFSLAVIAAGTSATRADDMSELVAAVAESMEQQTMTDAIHGLWDSGKPRYKAKKKSADLNVTMLDGILSSMKREAFRNMRRELYGEEDDLEAGDNDYFPPTLAGPEFYRPVPGFITSGFGWRAKFNRMHHGVDMSLHTGDTVRAAISGTVGLISYDHDGYGHYVVMNHNDGMQTLYGHLEHALVAQGQFIYAGQPIGIGGNTGNSTGPHLHFETRVGGVAVDPTLLFDFYGRTYFIADEKRANTDRSPVYSHQSASLRKESTYIVRFGDTPESIARQAGISVMKLRQLNMLSENEPLPLGRMLKLR